MTWLVWLMSALLCFPVAIHAATGVNIASQGAPGTGLCSITRQFSQTDMAAWHTTALTLVPSPSTGLTIFPITITASYNYTTSRYIFTDNLDPTTELRVGNITFKTFDAFPNLFHSSPSYPHVLQLLVATTNNGNLEPFVGAASSLKTTALSLVNVSGTARISGDGDVIISTQYYLLNSDGTISGQCTSSASAPSDGTTIGVGGNSGGPSDLLGSSGKINVQAHVWSGAGTEASHWTGWEVDLATNRSEDGLGCTAPSGYAAQTCIWRSGTTYYFPPGVYEQVYPVAFHGPGNPVTAPHYTYLEGSDGGQAVIYYNPGAASSSVFTIGKTGVHTFYYGVKNLMILPHATSVTNNRTITALTIIDGSFGSITRNFFLSLCTGFSVGLRMYGREFNFVNENHFAATLPAFLEGQPQGQPGGNPFSNLGVSRFEKNYYQGCDRTNPLITIGPQTVLSDVQFIGSSMVKGGYGVYWVSDYIGHDSAEKGLSQRVEFSNFRWEQMDTHSGPGCASASTTVGGSMFYIDLTNDIGLIGLKLSANGYGPECALAAASSPPANTLQGILLRNVHDVEISQFHDDTARTCGYLLNLSAVHNVRVSGAMSTGVPTDDSGGVVTACTAAGITSKIGLAGGVCKTFDTPASASVFALFDTSIHPTMIFDIPLSGGSCL